MKTIYTYPLGQKCNIVHYEHVSLFASHLLHTTSINEKIKDRIIFLSIRDLCRLENFQDKKKFNKIFEHLHQNNFCILQNDHKTNIEQFLKNLQYYIKNTKVNANKFFIILYLPSEVEPLKNKLREVGLEKINVTYKMNWLLWTKKFYKHYPEIEKSFRFSVFVRRFSDWRFDFYLKLIDNNILDNTIYSFSEGHPDFPNSEVTKDELKKMVPIQFQQRKKINDWIDSLPIVFKDETIYPVSDIVFRKLQQSYLHIVCETHIDYNDVTLTEKIYKPIVAGEPFIVAGQKGTLRLLKEQGFRTFDNIIDESYDDIHNNEKRLEAVSLELKRLNNLPLDQFIEKINSCQEIIQHNLQLANHYYDEGFPANYKKLNIFG